ncbi:hypothetical protein [Stenotrophomonas sp. MMGLT7]|uniref:hypothetical protein n=1 Tax=Stenotrophomonas sp. MMGLT7 TaxID=2901227 RepID=UPI001E5C8E1D|nr:hypothetical protein [Stenotrophomonas sp. MMGLT7]MCD7097798.1 hypothetical protein [Stenotrophomonas sp. MMGLT7]
MKKRHVLSLGLSALAALAASPAMADNEACYDECMVKAHACLDAGRGITLCGTLLTQCMNICDGNVITPIPRPSVSLKPGSVAERLYQIARSDVPEEKRS